MNTETKESKGPVSLEKENDYYSGLYVRCLQALQRQKTTQFPRYWGGSEVHNRSVRFNIFTPSSNLNVCLQSVKQHMAVLNKLAPKALETFSQPRLTFDADHHADCFSWLGLRLHDVLSGTHPFTETLRGREEHARLKAVGMDKDPSIPQNAVHFIFGYTLMVKKNLLTLRIQSSMELTRRDEKSRGAFKLLEKSEHNSPWVLFQ